MTLSIDDFGTGYSSLSYLKRFPVDAVKIDRAFIDGLGTDPHDSALVAAIIAMADALDLTVTAEGVETERQLATLRALHCGRAQGFHFAKPASAETMIQLLEQQPRWLAEQPDPTVEASAALPRDPTRPLAHAQDNPGNARSIASTVFEALPDASAVLAADGEILATNLAWRMFSIDNGGHPKSTDVGVNYLDVCDRSAAAHSSDAQHVAALLRDVLAGTRRSAEFEYACPAPDKRRWFSAHITSLPGGAVIVSHRNTTGRVIADEELRPLAAIVDPLTGAAARAALEARLHTLTDVTRVPPDLGDESDVGLIGIRLDGYGALSAELGQITADETLQALASRLSTTAGDATMIARITRTTFAVLATPTGPDALEQLAARIMTAAAQPHLIRGTQTDISTSVVTHQWRAGDDPAAVLDRLARTPGRHRTA